MVITVNASSFIFIIFGAVFLVTILAMLLKKGDRHKKIISLAVLVVVFIALFISFGRPSEIVVNEKGIKSGVYGKIEFSWDEVETARYIDNYQNTKYKPSLKISGTAMKDFRAGKFRLANGKTVKLVTQSVDDAVLFSTAEGDFLFAVDEIDTMIEIASKYTEVVY